MTPLRLHMLRKKCISWMTKLDVTDAGAQFAVGAGEIIPDLGCSFNRFFTRLWDGSYGSRGLGATAIGRFLGSRGRSRSANANGLQSGDVVQDMETARQWPADFLKGQKGF
ncbi:uncharacterized protein A4U43_C08F22470 [Asparagus officinalis]|nr:uncharacterized protein A4U43_C08F22470 [Asparagus officinalis]